MNFFDNTSKSPSERVANYRKYLQSIGFERQGMGTIDTAVGNWAYQQGFPELAMGGRRSRKGVKRSRKVKRKSRKTRSHRK